jgi:hypothetical protein
MAASVDLALNIKLAPFSVLNTRLKMAGLALFVLFLRRFFRILVVVLKEYRRLINGLPTCGD